MKETLEAMFAGRFSSEWTEEMEVLLRKAAALKGTPENIEEWARKLAESTCFLND